MAQAFATIDDYLATVPPTQRATLEALRATIKAVVPEAEECISYGVPGFRLKGKVIAGFASAKGWCSYFPHSGEVVERLADDLTGYNASGGTVRFPIDRPLPEALVRKLIEAKIASLAAR